MTKKTTTHNKNVAIVTKRTTKPRTLAITDAPAQYGRYLAMLVNPEDETPVRCPDGKSGAVALVKQKTVRTAPFVKDAAGNYCTGVIHSPSARDNVYVLGLPGASLGNVSDPGNVCFCDLVPDPTGGDIMVERAFATRETMQSDASSVNLPRTLLYNSNAAIPVRDGLQYDMGTGIAPVDVPGVLCVGSTITTATGATMASSVTGNNVYAALPGDKLTLIARGNAFDAFTQLNLRYYTFDANGNATQRNATAAPVTPVAGYQEISVGDVLAAGVVAWGYPQVVQAASGHPFRLDELQIVLEPNTSFNTVNPAVPFGWWVAQPTHDYRIIDQVSQSYRCIAQSLRYTDLTAKQYQSGQVACRVIDNRCGPGDANAGSYEELAAAEGAYEGLHADGVYAPLILGTTEDRRMRPVALPQLFELPYLVMMAKIAPQSTAAPGYSARIIAVNIFEIKTTSQLWTQEREDGNAALMQSVENAVARGHLIGDNPSHLQRIAAFIDRLTAIPRSIEGGVMPLLASMGPGGRTAAAALYGINRVGDLAQRFAK